MSDFCNEIIKNKRDKEVLLNKLQKNGIYTTRKYLKFNSCIKMNIILIIQDSVINSFATARKTFICKKKVSKSFDNIRMFIR